MHTKDLAQLMLSGDLDYQPNTDAHTIGHDYLLLLESVEYLLRVKKHRDEVGKDNWYELHKPLAWDQLKTVVTLINTDHLNRDNGID